MRRRGWKSKYCEGFEWVGIDFRGDLAFGRYVELKPHEVRRILNVGADRSL